MLIGIGSGVIISINLGKRDMNKAEKVLGSSFLLMILVSVLITIIGFSIKGPLLRLFGATAETLNYANDYLNINSGRYRFSSGGIFTQQHYSC